MRPRHDERVSGPTAIAVSRDLWGIPFVLPAFLAFALLFYLPAVQAVVSSLFEWPGVGPRSFTGLKNYLYCFRSNQFLQSVANTLMFMASSFMVMIPLALLLALLVDREPPGFRLFRSLFFVPCVLSTVVVGMVWMFMFNPYFGLIDGLFAIVGLESLSVPWLSDWRIALYSVMGVNIWQWTGYNFVILLTALKAIPEDIRDAALVDGAVGVRRLLHVLIPAIWPAIEVCVVLNIAGSLRAFDLVYVMTKGGPGYSTELMATYMWKSGFIGFRFGLANTVAVMILVLTILVTLGFSRLTRTPRKEW